MSNKKTESDFKINAVYFNKDVPVYLNYANKIIAGQYELSIRGNFLFIFDRKKEYTVLVPLTNVASMDVS